MTDAGRRRAWRAALLIAGVASAVPLWCTRFLPFADLPQHVAAIGILRHWWDPALGLRQRYALNVGDSQYFVYHAAGALLAVVVGGAETANRLILSAAAVAFPYSLRSLLRALARDERLALFAAPAFWSAPLMMGFAPYVAAVPVATWGIATFVRQARAPLRRRALGIAALACILFSLHLSAYLVFLGSAVLLSMVLLRRPAAIARALAWLMPSVALMFGWALRGSLVMPGAAQAAGPETSQIAWASTKMLAQQLPLWAHDIWRSHVDEACAVVMSLALVAIALQRGRPPQERRLARAAWAPLLVAVLAYAVLPYNIGPAVMLDVRMATYVVLFAPLVLAPRPGVVGTAAFVALLVGHLAGVADSIVEVRRVQNEELGDVGRLVDRIPADARVLTLPVHLTSRHTHWPPWVFLGSYHVARNGGEAQMSFTRIRHWPIRDRVEVDDPRRPLFWTLAPCTFRNAYDGPTADYLLVRARKDVMRSRPPGPRWRRVDQEREWWLYEREPGEWPQDGRTDAGPCADDEDTRTPGAADE
ncbi:MAG TPA: hypothetical protein VGG39_27700 [Polyangiaceae bacterium]